ncbi:LiaF transmembrane domain-containing protein [Chitinophaga lutea]
MNYTPHYHRTRKRYLWGGAALLTVGSVLLARRLDLPLPGWLFSWPMILIVIGTVLGIESRFRSTNWLVLILIGTVFLAKRFLHIGWYQQTYFWPIAFIACGLIIIVWHFIRDAFNEPRNPDHI